jgi:hypothetical protein
MRDTFKDSPVTLSQAGATSFALTGGPSLCVASAEGDFTPLGFGGPDIGLERELLVQLEKLEQLGFALAVGGNAAERLP